MSHPAREEWTRALPVSGRWRRTTALARDALARDWRTALMTALLAGSVIGLLAPIRAIGRAATGSTPTLVVPAIPTADGALAWTVDARSPDAIHREAVVALSDLLRGAGAAAAAIALLAILLRHVAHAGRLAGDIAIHRAVGGSRRGIAGWLAAEGSVIGAAGLGVGLAAAFAFLFLAFARWPGSPPAVPGTAPVWPGVAALALAVVLLSGLAPLAFSRDRHLASQPEGDVPMFLPTLQFGVALAFMTATTLLVGWAPRVGMGPNGAEAETGLVMQLDSGVAAQSDRARQFADLLHRLEASGDDRRYSLTSVGAELGLGTVDFVKTDCGNCVTGGIILRYHTLLAVNVVSSPDSFQMNGARVLDGRVFSPQDDWTAERVAVVNRHLALRHFEGGRAVGRDLFLGTSWPERPYRVIGIVDDAPPAGFGGPLQPRETVYLSILQHPPATAELVIRPAPSAPRSEATAAVREALGDGVVRPLGTERELRAGDAAPLQWFGGMFGAAAVIMLLAGVSGTVTMVALWVRTLAGPLAVRRAVGCSRRRALAYVGLRAGAIGVLGSLLGVVIYAGVLRAPMAMVAPRLPWWQPGILIRVGAVLVTISALAAIVPAWRQFRRPPAAYL